MQLLTVSLVFGCIIASIQSLPYGTVYDFYRRDPYDVGSHRPLSNQFSWQNFGQQLNPWFELAKEHDSNLIKSTGEGTAVLNIQGNKRVIKIHSGVNPEGVKYYKDFEDLFVDGQTFHTERVYNFETKELETKTKKVEKTSADKNAAEEDKLVPVAEPVVPQVSYFKKSKTAKNGAKKEKVDSQPEKPAEKVKGSPKCRPAPKPVDPQVEIFKKLAERENGVSYPEEPAEEFDPNLPICPEFGNIVDPQVDIFNRLVENARENASKKVPKEEKAVPEASKSA